jgi:hypothetical protein
VYSYAVNNCIINIDFMADNIILSSRFLAQLVDGVAAISERLRRLECATVRWQQWAMRRKGAAVLLGSKNSG